MLANLLEVIFKTMGYSMFIYGLWLLVGSKFYEAYVSRGIKLFNQKRRIKRLKQLEKNFEQKSKLNESSLVRKTELLLASVSKDGKYNVSNFFMLIVIIFLVSVTLLYYLIKDPFFSLMVSSLLASTPYLLARYKLEIIRLRTSLSFLNEFHIILQNYQSSNSNIYYTLKNTVDDLHDKDLKRQFHKLISSFQKDRSDIDFRNKVYVFVYSINSTFAKRFGNLIVKAHLDNANISNSLLSLSDDITYRKKSMEDESTEKLQSVMLGFAPLFVLPLVLYFSYVLTGVIDFWFYFLKPTSITLFIIVLISSIASVFLAFLMRKPRVDI